MGGHATSASRARRLVVALGVGVVFKGKPALGDTRGSLVGAQGWGERAAVTRPGGGLRRVRPAEGSRSNGPVARVNPLLAAGSQLRDLRPAPAVGQRDIVAASVERATAGTAGVGCVSSACAAGTPIVHGHLGG